MKWRQRKNEYLSCDYYNSFGDYTDCAADTECRAVTQTERFVQKKLGHLADCNPTKQDFENQRKAYRMIVDYLEEKAQYKICDKEV